MAGKLAGNGNDNKSNRPLSVPQGPEAAHVISVLLSPTECTRKRGLAHVEQPTQSLEAVNGRTST